MRIATALLMLLSTVAICSAKVELKDDPPSAAKPKAGRVTGSIEPAAKIASIRAVSRTTLKTYSPESFDKRTGRFVFSNLPGDAGYDVRVVTTDGRTIEGIDLSWIDARMVRLAGLRRKELGLAPERKHEFSMMDVNELLKWVADWEDFMDIKRVLYVQGHGKRATMLVELMRTREFHAAGGALVWRMELWYMKNEYGGWDRLGNSERVLHRKRIGPAEWRQIDLQYFPELSAFIDVEGKSEPIRFTLPEKGDLSRGRLRNTEPVVKTRPRIRGLDVKPTQPPPDVQIEQ